LEQNHPIDSQPFMNARPGRVLPVKR